MNIRYRTTKVEDSIRCIVQYFHFFLNNNKKRGDCMLVRKKICTFANW